MAHDVYKPCPFCTDKKLKFCCADIAEEMEKVGRLEAGGQTRAALKALDKLAVTHPATVWNEATRASLLMAEGRPAEAKPVLEALQAANPENPAVIALLAAAAFSAEGYEASRAHLERAYRKAAAYADIVSGVAMGVASEMFDRERYLSARAHLTLAMRFSRPAEQQAIFVRLLEFDGNAEIPYPLRSVHSLRDAGGDADRQDAARKAMRLAERGCYGSAAARFASLADAAPDDPAVWYDLALCRAWDADETAAADAFARAAAAEPDFELAAEYAALEQLLRAGEDAARVPMKNAEFRVPAAAVTIGDLDAHDRFVRVSLPPEAIGTAGVPDAVFEVIDRPASGSKPAAEITAEDLTPAALPRAIAQVAVFGTLDDADGPRAVLAGFEGADFDAAKNLFSAAVPGASVVEERVEPGDTTLPRDLAPLHLRLSYPERTPIRLRRQAENRRWAEAAETWLNTPQVVLGGKSPTDLAADPTHRTALAGAVYVLDAFALRAKYAVDVEGLRGRLGLPPVAPLAPQPDLPLNHLSAVQLHRLAIADLEDRQLVVTVNRALLIYHPRFLGPLLAETLRRSPPEIDRDRQYQTLADIARDQGDHAEALRWIGEGREHARSADNAFEQVFRWDTKELGLRLEDASDPDLSPFLRRMTAYYGPKVPRFTEYLNGLLVAYDIPMPSVLEAGGTAPSGGGLWTPGQTAGTGGGKLWVPGG